MTRAIVASRRRGRPPHLSETQRAQVLAWSREGVPLAEQARRLGVPRGWIMGFRRRLILAGLIAVHRTGRRRPWTPADDDMLIRLVEEGHAWSVIARRLGRTVGAARQRARRRLRLFRRSARAALTAQQVGALVGLPSGDHRVTTWITRDGLRARKIGGVTRGRFWQVAWKDLYAWLERPENWPLYDPGRVTDPALRAHLIELRANGPCWLTPRDLAARYLVDVSCVQRWVRTGRIPGVMRRGGRAWVRADALDGWHPPYTAAGRARRLRMAAPEETLA